MKLSPCPSCHAPLKSIFDGCPHCGATQRRGDRRVALTVAGVTLALLATGCPKDDEPTTPEGWTGTAAVTDTPESCYLVEGTLSPDTTGTPAQILVCDETPSITPQGTATPTPYHTPAPGTPTEVPYEPSYTGEPAVTPSPYHTPAPGTPTEVPDEPSYTGLPTSTIAVGTPAPTATPEPSTTGTPAATP